MSLFIKNITVIDTVLGEHKENVAILVEDGIISAIGNNGMNIPKGTTIVNGDDNYILPGFIDAHSHIMATGFNKEETMWNPLAMHFYNALKNMENTLNTGVTTIRDCGLADIGVKMAANQKLFPSPKMQISITPLSITGGHYDFYLNSGFDMKISYPGMIDPTCDGVEGVIHKTREVLRGQADFIKVMATGGVLSPNDSPSDTQFNKKELKAIVNEAKLRGKKVAAHCHGLDGIKNCIKAGIDSIEHATFIDKPTAKLMVDKGTYLVPTMIVHHTLNELSKSGNLEPRRASKVREIAKNHKENIAITYEEGVKLLMGSDSGVIEHGNNLKELEFLVHIGMSPIESIKAGTIEPAKLMGIDNKVGSIEVGKSADMILLKENPLDNIKYLQNSDNILMTILEGDIVKDIFN